MSDNPISVIPYFRASQVAAALNTCTRTIQRIIASGDLPAVKVGAHWRIRQDDLNEYLANRRAVLKRVDAYVGKVVRAEMDAEELASLRATGAIPAEGEA